MSEQRNSWDKDGMPPVPFPFVASPETYWMAVHYYLDGLVTRARDDDADLPGLHVTARGIIDVMRQDAKQLDAARKAGEPV
jgi:hypothetical protein